MYGGNEGVALQILTLTPGGGEHQIYISVTLLPKKQPPVPYAHDAGLQHQCGCDGEEKNLFPLLGIKP